MNQRSLSVLIVLNVVLLAAIALTLGPVPKAQAQLGGGSYLMLAGNNSQIDQQVIYILNTRNGEVAGFTLNSATKRIEGVGKREIGKDIQRAGGSGGSRGR